MMASEVLSPPFTQVTLPMRIGLFVATVSQNRRIDDLRTDITARFAHMECRLDARFTALEKIWDEKLSRVEGVTDARLKHPEEQ